MYIATLKICKGTEKCLDTCQHKTKSFLAESRELRFNIGHGCQAARAAILCFVRGAHTIDTYVIEHEKTRLICVHKRLIIGVT